MYLLSSWIDLCSVLTSSRIIDSIFPLLIELSLMKFLCNYKDTQHDHVVTEGSQLTENYVFLTESCFCRGFSFLFSEKSHFFIGSFENGGFPEIIFFPNFTLIHIRAEIEKFLVFVISPIIGKNKPKNSSNNEGIILLLTLLDDRFQQSAA